MCRRGVQLFSTVSDPQGGELASPKKNAIAKARLIAEVDLPRTLDPDRIRSPVS